MAIISMGRVVGAARTAQFGTGHRVEWTGRTPNAPQARPALGRGRPEMAPLRNQRISLRLSPLFVTLLFVWEKW